ncbi:MAG TPA: RNA-binding cell elongation regulator Jag/EloR [Thermomicrobiales bacterium]|nr:RNA-binding cell elongation regulator Jag/EloR [Thermomicrobiales bacterium]
MRSVEIQARSTDEAVRLALEQLGATRNEVEVQVLAETEDDIYGEGEVLVRVSVRGSVAPPRGDRGQARGGQRGPGRDSHPRDSRPPRQHVPGRPGSAPRRGPAPASQGVYRPPQVARPRQPSQASDEQTQAVEALAKEVVRDLLTRMDVAADVMAVDNPSVMPVGNDDPLTVFIDIMGRDLGQLIGRRGENLSQLQYMVNLLVNKRNEEWVRVVVDVEGYRSQREESLIGLAERVARQVARNRRPIALDPMPPNERRIVHMTLKSLPDVRTESSGEGDLRRVTIFPQ